MENICNYINNESKNKTKTKTKTKRAESRESQLWIEFFCSIRLDIVRMRAGIENRVFVNCVIPYDFRQDVVWNFVLTVSRRFFDDDKEKHISPPTMRMFVSKYIYINITAFQN